MRVRGLRGGVWGPRLSSVRAYFSAKTVRPSRTVLWTLPSMGAPLKGEFLDFESELAAM